MTRIDTTQDIILTRIVARLAEQLDLPPHRCYETLEPLLRDPPLIKGGDYYLTVSPGDGRFDEAMQHGGGAAQLMEMGSVTVTAYSRLALDPMDRATKILHEDLRGMMVVKRSLLIALVGHDLLDEDGNALLRAQIYAIQSWRPIYNAENKVASVAIGFGTDFDWELDD